ncbi:MAG TPA: ATPase domain-containing protein [Gemmatimonadaceae bacterium]|jgi:circadian clock protein KaiC|nr:ATPase domain-containing protein [Gemmatimonadaceae bacterium]
MTERRPGQPPPDDEDSFPRVRSGNPQVDEILGGGFPSNSINIVMGQPGTGKTILAEQLLYHNAGDDRPLLYATTLSEPLSKVVSYVQRFSFFNPDVLGSDVMYEDLGASLAERGPVALIEWLDEAIKTRSPKIVVIDSFRAIHDLGTSLDDMRRFISALAGLLSAYDVTTFLLGEYTQADIERCPEFAVADAIVELARQPLSTRDERFMRVMKLRGSGYREGQHAFRITSDGLQLYPRLVAPREFESYKSSSERVSTGIPGLDEIMGGGLLVGSTTLAVGMTGAGKTTLALQFALEGVRRGEQVLYVNFQENPVQLRRAIANLGGEPATAFKNGFGLLYASPVELQIDSIVVEIFEAIKTGGVRRVVIDAVGDLSSAANDPRRLHDYLYSLIQHFAARGVTSVLTLEAGQGFHGMEPSDQWYSYMSDNVIALGWNVAKPDRRTIRVFKMRSSEHDHEVREFEIGSNGARVT